MNARALAWWTVGGVALVTLAGACKPREAAESPIRFRSPAIDHVMDQADRKVRTRGFSKVERAQRGFLVEADADVRELFLRSGTCDVAIAASSPALTELDLRYYDADGTAVAHDAAKGSTSVARFCPSQTGSYYLAARASAGSGLYALRRYAGPAGLELTTADLFGDGAGSVDALERRSSPP